jgi:hypothetical protein
MLDFKIVLTSEDPLRYMYWNHIVHNIDNGIHMDPISLIGEKHKIMSPSYSLQDSMNSGEASFQFLGLDMD